MPSRYTESRRRRPRSNQPIIHILKTCQVSRGQHKVQANLRCLSKHTFRLFFLAAEEARFAKLAFGRKLFTLENRTIKIIKHKSDEILPRAWRLELNSELVSEPPIRNFFVHVCGPETAVSPKIL